MKSTRNLATTAAGIAVALAALALSSVAMAQDCNVFIGDHINWMARSDRNYLDVRIVTLAPSNVASYSSGTITRLSRVRITTPPAPPLFLRRASSTNLRQLFNNRSTRACLPGAVFCDWEILFDTRQADRLGVSLLQNIGVTFTLLDHGNYTMRVNSRDAVCSSDGMMTGPMDNGKFIMKLTK
ncbi:MAG: hypothetical protein IT372_38330, partial [Polyangiaceae bacterium]|nr:hypothetical protein [Polyangiaceae bacterium]